MGKPLIGSRAEAEIILATEGIWDEPPGWTLLGSGCYRTAYLAPSDVVYKIGHSRANRQEVRTSRRLRNRVFPGVYIPKASQFVFWRPNRRGVNEERVVVAMEYIEGEHPPGCWASMWNGRTELYCYCGEYPSSDDYQHLHVDVPLCKSAQAMRDLDSKTPVTDIHNGNVILMADGRYAIIDLQM